MDKPQEGRQDKSELVVARITCFLTGTTKKHFFEEIKRTGVKECHLAREIITQYYKRLNH